MKLSRSVQTLAAAACLVALTACSGLPQDDPSPPSATAPAPSPSESEAPPTEVPTPDISASPTPIGNPVATRKSSIGEVKVELDVFPLHRSGQTVVMNVQLRNLSESERTDVGRGLSGRSGVSMLPENWDPDGFKLIDGVNKKAHLVARSGDDVCLCSPQRLGVLYLDAKQTMMITATFGAPPADVTTMDVMAPLFGTVTDVPIE